MIEGPSRAPLPPEAPVPTKLIPEFASSSYDGWYLWRKCSSINQYISLVEGREEEAEIVASVPGPA